MTEFSLPRDILLEMVDTVGVGVGIYDATGQFLYVNESYADLFDSSTHALNGAALWDVVQPLDADKFDGYWDSFEDGETRTDETIHQFNGARVPVETVTTRRQVDSVPYHFGTIKEIREPKKQEQKLEQLHVTTRDLLMATSSEEVASIACDAATELLDLPLVGVHLYDSSADALVPVAWSAALTSVLDGPPPSISAGDGIVWKTYADGEARFHADLRDGAEILNPDTPFKSELFFPLGEHGVILVGSTEIDDFDTADKTLAKVWAANVEAALDRIEREEERKRYEKQLEKTTEELEALNRIVRHDIRNDMGIILGWAEFLNSHVDDDGQDYLQKILTSGEHVVELTDIARDYIEMLTSEDGLEVSPTPLQSTVERQFDLRRESFPEAEFVLVDEVPRVAVRANKMLGAVFRNLLNNAVQHNDKDDPRVWVSCEVDDEDVVVRIADNGPGIPDGQKESVFGKGDKGLESAGSGVGLYLVQTLVDQFDGSVAVEDNEPEGAVFVVRLRKADEEWTGSAEERTSEGQGRERREP